MGILDTFHFDDDDYYKEHHELNATILRKKHHQKVMHLTTAIGGVAIGVGGAIVTGGVSLCSGVYSGRQHYIANQKKDILEKIMKEREIEIPQIRKRDVAGGAAIAVTNLGLTHSFNSISQC